MPAVAEYYNFEFKHRLLPFRKRSFYKRDHHGSGRESA